MDEEHKKIESMQALIEQINKDREVLKIRVEGLVKTKSKVGIIKLCFYLFYWKIISKSISKRGKNFLDIYYKFIEYTFKITWK